MEILYSIEKYSATVIVAETGSGKTTRILFAYKKDP